ncbi:ATP-binding cassette domain-containing protein [Trichocoleus sp. FACHB-262]|uniref:ABC transporter ATP-binding protein n=1 Tax=Trichocoleus sp. FACHB-262 TaxID=2692869 RepID=UPI001689C619|nr:ATP-binding cassette domain-containing protein [Trichocoleus sp. FACHB-262]MBD2124683.1 ABC transporter ATP-binding protein [Trichocoleus sp. FACHB-262]
MSDTVIRVENLGKKYIIGHQQQGRSRYTALRDVLADGAKSVSRRILNPFAQQPLSPTKEEFWALKDVSFEIKQGDRVGIIGRNGAGKSTLLKLLSRITEPTKGRISIKGRVASLLEVGTGFHPELTGRENIYLNGAILGMSKAEIKKKFDEIVDFAEVEKFLDTPVKYYSSGMYVRLAFAVAAHLATEILIVDEVLAVGDSKFQKKCLSTMEKVTQEGKTILFVSHNMTIIEHLCNRGILLDAGRLTINSKSEEAIQVYLKNSYTVSQTVALEARTDRSGSGRIRASGIKILNQEGQEETTLRSGENYFFEVECLNYTHEVFGNVVISLDVFDEKNNRLLLLRSNFTNDVFSFEPGRKRILCELRELPLANGLYRGSIFLSHADQEILDYIEDAISINVDGGDFFGTGSYGLPSHCRILTKANWLEKFDFKNLTI